MCFNLATHPWLNTKFLGELFMIFKIPRLISYLNHLSVIKVIHWIATNHWSMLIILSLRELTPYYIREIFVWLTLLLMYSSKNMMTFFNIMLGRTQFTFSRITNIRPSYNMMKSSRVSLYFKGSKISTEWWLIPSWRKRSRRRIKRSEWRIQLKLNSSKNTHIRWFK